VIPACPVIPNPYWFPLGSRVLDADGCGMGAMDIKRCPHCVGRLRAMPLDELDGFEVRAPVVTCDRCDSDPNDGESLLVPDAWE
jgi:hypothetical protein